MAGQAQGVSYSDSKLYVTVLAAAVARLWPDVLSNAVDPGWVPTKMGGPSAPDDLRLGHLTQEWLATSDDPEARTSGGYWHHQHREKAHPSLYDHRFQNELVDHLAPRHRRAPYLNPDLARRTGDRRTMMICAHRAVGRGFLARQVRM
jgi:NAD(P)-dependent dehydrogenase (short-subunit alcohol dehydrogenase family)